MKSYTYDTREEWLAARRGKITGSRLKDLIVKRGTGKKIGFYELIAERIAVASDGENPMDRGTRLEEEAMARFSEEVGRPVDTSLVLWAREDNESIAISPDGILSDAEAVEVKCLSSARHIEAWLTKEIPDEYKMQALQYFIVNDQLQCLFFVFYDPRIPCKDFFYFEILRDQEQVDQYLEEQKRIIEEVNDIVSELIF